MGLKYTEISTILGCCKMQGMRGIDDLRREDVLELIQNGGQFVYICLTGSGQKKQHDVLESCIPDGVIKLYSYRGYNGFTGTPTLWAIPGKQHKVLFPVVWEPEHKQGEQNACGKKAST